MRAQGAGGGRRWWIVGLVVLLVAGLATVGVVVLTSRGSSASASVTLESASSAGKDPFSDSVQIGPAVAFPGNVTAIVTTAQHKLPVDDHTHTYVATGTAPGLYGGTGNTHVCDPAKLVSYLQQHPDKARAWAGVFGIAPSDIANYVATLTPVVLTTDTLVTNHGYRNGVANPLQSVLQAGAAVLVDATGAPRVKCNCGNPLTPPEPINVTNATITGTPWTGYHPTRITTIKRGPKTSTFTLINVRTGDTYTQPAGNGAGGQWVAVQALNASAPGEGHGVIVTSRDGATWATVGPAPSAFVAGLATDGRTWEIIVSDGSGSEKEDVLASPDLRTWHQVATLDGEVQDLAYGNGRWTAVGSVGQQTAEGAVFSSSDGSHWTQVAATQNPSLLVAAGYGNGRWVAAGGGSPVAGVATLTSTDGTHWTPGGTPAGAAIGGIDYGAGKLAMATANSAAPTFGGGIVTDNRTNFSTDGQTWTSQPATGVAGAGIESFAHGGNEWLATATDPSGADTTVMTSTNAVSWSTATTLPGRVDHLAYGPVSAGRTTPIGAPPPPTAAPTTTTTTTTLPPAPKPTPPASPPSSASAGPCTAAAITPALAPDHQLDGTPICVGTWAYALVLDKSGPQNSWADVNNLFQWNGQAWVPYQGEYGKICTPGVLPQAIYFPECQTN